MTKLSRLLLLLNLLQYRQKLSVTDIMRTCRVSRRTAFRYIDALSQSNVPLYHDRSVGGYRLSSPHKIYTDQFTTLDGILLRIALRLIETSASGAYSDAIEQLKSKINTFMPSAVSELVTGLDEQVAASSRPPDTVQLIHSLVLEAAMQLGHSVRVLVNDGNGTSAMHIESPSLQFKEQWSVGSRRKGGKQPVSLTDIKEIVLLEGPSLER